MSRSRTNPLQAVSAWILFSALPLTSWAGGAGDACLGPVAVEHPLPPYHFYTNSIVEKNLDAATNGQYPYVSTSCIANAPPYPPTEVHWFAPSIHGWLQQDSPSLFVHRLEVGNNAQQMDGCLQYANQSQFIQARLLGDEEEAKEVDHEKKVGCRQAARDNARAVAGSEGTEEKLINVAQSFTNYFPSLAKYARETMLRLDGQAGVIAGDNSYKSYFRYTLNPVNGSKGDPNVITVAPAFVGPAEVLINNYRAQNPPTIRGDSRNEIRFIVNDVKNPKLVYATYDFLDDEHEIVASVDVPVFVSRGK